MNPLRIHLQLIGMAILWGASWPWGRMVAQAMPTFVASSLRFFFAIIPLIIWLYAANRFRYAKQLSANQWIGLFVTAFFGVFAYSTFFIWGLKYLQQDKRLLLWQQTLYLPRFWRFFYLKKNGIDG